jgi:hypothetical protein
MAVIEKSRVPRALIPVGLSDPSPRTRRGAQADEGFIDLLETVEGINRVPPEALRHFVVLDERGAIGGCPPVDREVLTPTRGGVPDLSHAGEVDPVGALSALLPELADGGVPGRLARIDDPARQLPRLPVPVEHQQALTGVPDHDEGSR